MVVIEGRVWKYGDDINTDLIFPGRYTYQSLSEEEMGIHALEDLDSNFTKEARPGDIIVAGKNWGCGSAREQAVKAIRARGVAAIIARSFSRIYFRNALNEGLPVIVCAAAAAAIEGGENVQIDLEEHCIHTETGDFLFSQYDVYIQQMLSCGGLIPHVKKELGLL